MLKSLLKIFIIVVAIGFFFASPALALDSLVPACGRTGAEPCTTCDLLALGKNISDFILFYLVPALSAVFFVYAGFEIIVGGGIPARVLRGQNIFRTTVLGLIIIFLSWMIVNTVLRTVAGDRNIAENWWKLECRETVTTVTGGGGNTEGGGSKKYACQDNQCVESATGTFTEPACNNSCGIETVPGALAISGVKAENISENSATIFWTSNRPATSQVEYTNTATGQTNKTTLERDKKASHAVQLSGLIPNTNYTATAISVDGSQSDSKDVNFKTGAQAAPMAVIISPSSPVVRVTTPATSITFTGTNLPANTNVMAIMTKNGVSQPNQNFNTGSPASLNTASFRADPGDEGNWTLKLKMPDGTESNTISFIVVPPVATTTLTPTPTPTPTRTPTPTPTVSPATPACKFSGENLCQESTVISSTFCGFSSSSCMQFNGAVQKAASKISIGGLNSAALIKSFIINESSCNINAYNAIIDPKTGEKKESCGPMQMQASTANTLKQFCGISASITCGWLRNPANIDGIVCLGAQYIKSLSSGACGTVIRNIAAGYNGGAGACAPSKDCASEKSCDGGTVLRWECLYDNVQHTVCNTRYNETKAYAPKVIACYNKNK